MRKKTKMILLGRGTKSWWEIGTSCFYIYIYINGINDDKIYMHTFWVSPKIMTLIPCKKGHYQYHIPNKLTYGI